jgi:hypothetical protein
MAETMTIRAQDHRAIVVDTNMAKRLYTGISGMENELVVKKTGITAALQGLFNTGLTAAEPPTVYSGFKIECTRMVKADGLDVEVPDGVVQGQMKVVRKELVASDLAIADAAGPDVRAALTISNQVVDLVDPARVLAYLAANPGKVTIKPSGTGLSISLVGDAHGVDGVSFKSAVLPVEGFLDKVVSLTADQRARGMGFVKHVLGKMLAPTLVFGNRTTAGAAE